MAILANSQSFENVTPLIFSVNRQGKNKNWNYEVLTSGFEDTTGDLEDLKQEIVSGHAITGAHFNGQRRKTANVTQVGLLLVDVDGGMTIDEAKANSFIQAYCALGYTTHSHKPDHHKFRLIFPLPQAMERIEFEQLVGELLKQFPHDPSCKDSGRAFYGNTEAEFFIDNPKTKLPQDFIDTAIAKGEIERKEAERKRQERIEWLKNNPQYISSDAIPLIDCCRKEVRKMVMVGVPVKSGHNDAALSIALELVGVERYLEQIGQPFSGSARDYYDQFIACSGVSDGKLEGRWEWAESRQDIDTSIPPESIQRCIYAHEFKRLRTPKERDQFRQDHPDFEPINGARSTNQQGEDDRQNLSDLLLADGELREILLSAIQISKSFDDPIYDLKTWIQATFSTLSISSTRLRGIQIAAAVCWQFGDKLTNLEICQLIQQVCGISRVDVIQAEFKRAKLIIDPPIPATQKALQAITAAYGEGAIRYNELSGKAEKNGEEFKDVDLAYMGDELAEYELPKTLATDAILVAAKKNRYHPVKDYLESLRGKLLLAEDQWDNLAFHLLGTEDELAQIILKKSLIAAVARIYRPGCYVRMVPVLQGEQNAGKSTFLRLLAGDEFFCDSLGKLDNAKDDCQLLNSHWIHEWGEFDKLSKKSAGEVKAFITKTKDDYRSPYARSPESHKRQCVIFGSCNRRDFLKDSTGNTRYSVIEVGKVDLELVKQWRDSIWATALARFEAGEAWELTQAEQALSEVNNQAYAELDAWHEDIENYVSLRTEVSLSAILDHLGIEKSKKDSLNSKRVRDVLTTLGWRKDKNPSTFQGQRTRVWRSPLAPRTTTAQPPLHNSLTSCVEVVSEVVSSEKLTNQDFQPLNTTCTTKNTKNFSGNKTTSLDTVPQADLGVGEFSEKPNRENNCAGCVDIPQTNTGQGIQPCTATAQLLHNPSTTVVSEVVQDSIGKTKSDAQPRPYPQSDPKMHPEAEQNLIVSKLLSASNKAELARVKSEWKEDSMKWIYNYRLTPEQKASIKSKSAPQLVDGEVSHVS